MLGELSYVEVESVLHSQVIGRIGCSDRDRVYVVPITYAYDGTFIYCHSKAGLKIALMRENPSVCFEVEEVKDMTHWKSVILWGTFEELEGEEERNNGIQVFSERMKSLVTSESFRPMIRQPEPHPPEIGPKPIFFRIRVRTKTGRFELG